MLDSLAYPYRLKIYPDHAHPAIIPAFESYKSAHDFLLQEVATLHPRGGKWWLYQHDNLIAAGSWRTISVSRRQLAVTVRELFRRDIPD